MREGEPSSVSRRRRSSSATCLSSLHASACVYVHLCAFVCVSRSPRDCFPASLPRESPAQAIQSDGPLFTRRHADRRLREPRTPLLCECENVRWNARMHLFLFSASPVSLSLSLSLPLFVCTCCFACTRRLLLLLIETERTKGSSCNLCPSSCLATLAFSASGGVCVCVCREERETRADQYTHTHRW